MIILFTVILKLVKGKLQAKLFIATSSCLIILRIDLSATELVIHYASDTTPQGIPITHKMLFRAPTTELKYTWKSLLEQKVHIVGGLSTDYYSLSDCSGSAVII
jgi:hypothetical protein